MIVTTLHGDMDESLLEKRIGTEDYPDAMVTWVEYWHQGELVHRSVNAALKGRDIGIKQAQLG